MPRRRDKKNDLSQAFDKRLSALARSSRGVLAGGRKGIEKEALRLDADGYLAQTPHPPALGSAMTNRYITTDFSEALLEFVTPAFESTWETLRLLCDIHQFTYEQLEDEHMLNSIIEGSLGQGRDLRLKVDGHLCPFATTGIILIAAGSTLVG